MPRTPTQVLIDCMEDFGTDEPLEVLVIYRTKGGDLAWQTDQEDHSHVLGMLEMTKFWFLENRRKEEK
jgi:hypothetical protein